MQQQKDGAMNSCQCAVCLNEKPFQVPRELLERFAAGNCVIFAGAGISTENPVQCRSTFYETIAAEISEEGADELDFPSLMSAFSDRPDGRIKLIQKIRDRIEYFRSFRGFYIPMTRFHRALRPLHMIEDVITTNWDDFFEAEAGFEPFVYDQDLAFLDSSKRRVIKIHGSISNAGSIVATSDDYRNALRRLERGSLGAYLKTLLTTKTIIYIGYSLRDKNYLSLVKSLNKLLGGFSRTSYFVSPSVDLDYLRSIDLKLVPIETDGSFFLEQMRKHINEYVCEHQKIISEESFDFCAEFLGYINAVHNETADMFMARRKPLMILALTYQDGLQDALMRIKDRRSTGEYYNARRLDFLIGAYQQKYEDFVSQANYCDASYCRGYQNGLILLATGGEATPPLVDVCFDDAIDTVSKAARFAIKRIPPDVLQYIKRVAAKLPAGHLPEHMPYL
jgi:hypothetical protein